MIISFKSQWQDLETTRWAAEEAAKLLSDPRLSNVAWAQGLTDGFVQLVALWAERAGHDAHGFAARLLEVRKGRKLRRKGI